MDMKIRNEDLIKILSNSKFGWKVSLYIPAGKTNEEVEEYLRTEIATVSKMKVENDKEEINYCLTSILRMLFFRNEEVSMVYFVDSNLRHKPRTIYIIKICHIYHHLSPVQYGG